MNANTLDGEKLKRLRYTRIGRQADLASRMGVSREAVNRWESGVTQPSANHFLALCDVLECQPDELLQEEVSQ